jgi:uncharacterized protein YecE (DUF72 family)
LPHGTECVHDAARALEEKLLCCLLQFGYFNPKVFPDFECFLARLDRFLSDWPADVPVAVEIRNKHWFTQEFADCLRKHNAVWAISDQAWTPQPLRLVKQIDVKTGPFAYLRLLGDRAEVDKLAPTLDKTVINRDQQIADDAEVIELLSIHLPVYTFGEQPFSGIRTRHN